MFFEICVTTDRQTDRHTYMTTAILLNPTRGKVTIFDSANNGQRHTAVKQR